MQRSKRGALVLSVGIGLALVPTIGSADRAHATSTRYQIGCEGPLSGANAVIGVNSCQAVELAARLANKTGALPYHLSVKLLDDQGDPTRGPAVAIRATNDPVVLAVVGPNFSGTALATGRIYATNHMLVVTPSATNPMLTLPKYHFTTFFRAVASDTVEGAGGGRYLAHLAGVDRVAVVDDRSAYGRTEARQVQLKLHAAGVAHFSRSLDGVTSQYPAYVKEARRIVKRGANAVYYGGYDAQAGLFAKALHHAGFKGSYVTDDSARSPVFFQHAGRAAAADTTFTSPFAPDSSFGAVKKFAAMYRHQFHSSPGETSVEAFDAANSVILDLTKLSATPTRRQVVAGYRSINSPGLVGPLSFNHRHELRHPPLFLYRAKGRHIVFAHKLPA